MTSPDKTWRKSSYTAPDNNCVELAVSNSQAAIRDSKDPGGGMLNVSTSAWSRFLMQVKLDRCRH
ncbi:DUF397 domain-containing protein [Lentzea sp. HUAS12]|uniref:DUF397 domain-containing protein n=1 Tax=Lentzea sp. HUAS12 TaxID=2951806 RepID=UPI00209FB8D7|nr:DUF397 domain-containing protein [Lentzea sp. HUAS12]USX49327.1 DUF397 domain-containing protein [Lentzea sp. HUAS12]